jgi:uncharacterized protein (TIGR00645 family)
VIEISLEGIWHIFEDYLERIFFKCRWFLAPMYLLLIVVIIMIVGKFFIELGTFISDILTLHSDAWITEALDLLDLTLIANLVLIVAFSGYENSISKMDFAHEKSIENISWMGNLDISGLKLKIIGSVVAISIIELLKDFLNAATINPETEIWRVVLHIIFVITGLIFARMEMINAKKSEIESKEELMEMEKDQFEKV